MHQKYNKPEIEIIDTDTILLQNNSGVTSDVGIDYGGVDEEGNKDPSGRRNRDVWDDEEDESSSGDYGQSVWN